MTADAADGRSAPLAVTLAGPDHPRLGEHVTRPVGVRAAVGISAGRYPKAVAALDANEDAAAVVTGPGGSVTAVADGHFGADAAVAAVDAVTAAGRAAVVAPVRDPRAAVATIADAAADAVADARAAAADDARRDSATALVLLLVVDRAVWSVTFGDVAAVRVRHGRPRTLSRPSPFLTGAGADVAPRRSRLRTGDHVVAVSDGVVDHLGRSWREQVATAVTDAATPADAVEAIMLGAMDGAAGDHLSCVVLRRE